VRHILFAILVAVPTALVTYLVASGTGVCRLEGGPTVAAPAKPGVVAAPADPDTALKALFATPIADFTLKGEVPLYDQKGLFDYIDGAAPVFIDRHFRMLAAAELKLSAAATGGELTADAYDMNSAENAASIYTFERPPTAAGLALGDAAHQGRMSLVFRKGRYYVKLTAFDAIAEAKLPDLARLLVSRIP